MILPKKLKLAPGKLRNILNGLVDFVVSQNPQFGSGFVVRETNGGRTVTLQPSILDAADAINNAKESGEGIGKGTDTGGGWGAPTGGGSSGVFPGVTTDADGNATYDATGKPFGWQTLRVCVVDADGNKTEVTLDVPGSLNI